LLRRWFSLIKKPKSSTVAAAFKNRRAVPLTRDTIVTKTVQYLRQHPHEPLTLGRVGVAIGATPMAVYRYFEDAADLSDAILSRVLAGLRANIPASVSWRQQAASWIASVCERLVGTPQCVGMLTAPTGPPVAWIRATVLLKEILQAGGLQGKALSEATFWISLVTGGFAQQTLSRPIAAHIAATQSAIKRLSPPEIDQMSALAVDVPRVFNNALQIVTERMLASIEDPRFRATKKGRNLAGATKRSPKNTGAQHPTHRTANRKTHHPPAVSRRRPLDP
jgi:AcrR family transcriptional regulator